MYWRVSDVMTPDVVTASEDALVGEIVDKLVTHRVSGLPIVDDGDRLVGVVSQADLLPRVAATRPAGGRTRRGRRAAKAAATSARQLMTAPALTIGADEPLSAAARKMQLKKVKRLLVTGDDGQLLGIVSRADLLRLYARADTAIRGDVVNTCSGAPCGSTPARCRSTSMPVWSPSAAPSAAAPPPPSPRG